MAAGLVRVRREGRYRFHDLDTSPVQQIADRWQVHDRAAAPPQERHAP